MINIDPELLDESSVGADIEDDEAWQQWMWEEYDRMWWEQYEYRWYG